VTESNVASLLLRRSRGGWYQGPTLPHPQQAGDSRGRSVLRAVWPAVRGADPRVVVVSRSPASRGATSAPGGRVRP